jgi:hypothetical protein
MDKAAPTFLHEMREGRDPIYCVRDSSIRRPMRIMREKMVGTQFIAFAIHQSDTESRVTTLIDWASDR